MASTNAKVDTGWQEHDVGSEPPAAEGGQTVERAGSQENVHTSSQGSVSDDFQRGYKLRDRVLRPAMVRVPRKPKN